MAPVLTETKQASVDASIGYRTASPSVGVIKNPDERIAIETHKIHPRKRMSDSANCRNVGMLGRNFASYTGDKIEGKGMAIGSIKK